MHRDGFVRIGNKYFEHVKSLILDHLPIVSEQIHAYFEVVSSVHICSHDAIVGPVQQNFSEEFDGLPLRDIAAGLHQSAIVFFEKHVEIYRQVSRNKILVPSQQFLSRMSTKYPVEWFANQVSAVNSHTLNVVNASAATSNELLSIQSKNLQNTPLPLCGRSRSIAFNPLALEPGSSPSS